MIDIIARSGNKDIGYVLGHDVFDCSVSLITEPSENRWSLDLDTRTWARLPLNVGDTVYVLEDDQPSEIGGRVEYIMSNTGRSLIRLQGSSWRGLLNRKIVRPPMGETHMVVNGEAHTIISNLIGDQFGDLIEVETANSGILVSGESRYGLLSEFINRLLSDAGGVLNVRFDPSIGRVKLKAVPVNDLADEVTLTEFHGVGLTATIDKMEKYNHVIGLGGGEMLERTVKEYWMLPNGEITEDPGHPDRPRGADEISYKYDYGSVESIEDLNDGAYRILREGLKTDSLDANLLDEVNLGLGDVISGEEQVTGIQGSFQVSRKIVRSAASREYDRIDYLFKEI